MSNMYSHLTTALLRAGRLIVCAGPCDTPGRFLVTVSIEDKECVGTASSLPEAAGIVERATTHVISEYMRDMFTAHTTIPEIVADTADYFGVSVLDNMARQQLSLMALRDGYHLAFTGSGWWMQGRPF